MKAKAGIEATNRENIQLAVHCGSILMAGSARGSRGETHIYVQLYIYPPPSYSTLTYTHYIQSY